MDTKHKPKVVTTIRLDPAAYHALKRIAEREHRSLSREMQRLVDEHIERHNGTQVAA